jgi:hypothetical protein
MAAERGGSRGNSGRSRESVERAKTGSTGHSAQAGQLALVWLARESYNPPPGEEPPIVEKRILDQR